MVACGARSAVGNACDWVSQQCLTSAICEICCRLSHRPVDAVALPARAQAVCAGKEFKVLHHRELAIKREFLRDIADELTCRRSRITQVCPRHLQGPAACRQQAAEHAEG